MDSLSYKTLPATPAAIKKEWVVVDATDQVLGRLCAKIALVLRGKNKPCYTPYMDCGDNVIPNSQTVYICATPAIPADSVSLLPRHS